MKQLLKRAPKLRMLTLDAPKEKMMSLENHPQIKILKISTNSELSMTGVRGKGKLEVSEPRFYEIS